MEPVLEPDSVLARVLRLARTTGLELDGVEVVVGEDGSGASVLHNVINRDSSVGAQSTVGGSCRASRWSVLVHPRGADELGDRLCPECRWGDFNITLGAGSREARRHLKLADVVEGIEEMLEDPQKWQDCSNAAFKAVTLAEVSALEPYSEGVLERASALTTGLYGEESEELLLEQVVSRLTSTHALEAAGAGRESVRAMATVRRALERELRQPGWALVSLRFREEKPWMRPELMLRACRVGSHAHLVNRSVRAWLALHPTIEVLDSSAVTEERPPDPVLEAVAALHDPHGGEFSTLEAALAAARAL